MSIATDMAERRLAILGELAELGLSLARDLHSTALAAEDIAEKSKLAEAFHRTGRSIRQSLALHAKLERDDARAEHEDRAAAASQASDRKAQVKAAVKRLIWTEYEPAEAEPLVLDLLDHLDEARLHDDFLDADVDTLIAKVCKALNLLPLREKVSGERPTDEGSITLSATPPPRAASG